jgi:lysyl-tRNA synthetase, class II
MALKNLFMREDIQKIKLEKLENLKKYSMDPYPEKNERSMTNAEAIDNFDEIKEDIHLVGRVKSFRPMGNAAFAHIEDGTGKIQIFLNKDNLDGGKYDLFISSVEAGDFIEVDGKLFKTKTEEKTLSVKDWKMLAKNMRPIPTEYFGLKDIEELLRRRYLDLMMNLETRELFRKKRLFWHTIRHFLVKNDFLEVQTPVFEHIPSGAEAEPFVTHYNALNQDFYLRISLELPLKRLLVGGYERVFEMGRVFRNEGIDRDHLQEFDHMEFYAAYWDMKRGMKFSEKLFKEVVFKVTGGYETQCENNKIDWSKKFQVIDYLIEFKRETGIDLGKDVSVETIRTKADELGIEYDPSYGKGRMIDTIYKKTVRKKMIQPSILTGHPVEVSPFAKRDPKNPRKTLRFQIVAGGSELYNAFSELNDPIDQKSRFLEQMKLREAGDKEALIIDEDFIEALEYGMPPAFGVGMSERFFAFIMNKSVRECVIFPAIKTKGDDDSKK